MTSLAASPLRGLLGARLARYLGVSVLALGVDLAAYLLLLRFAMAPVAASVLAYGLGVVAHWLLSSRSVFAPGLARAGRLRLRQQALFAMSALVGLGVTGAVVAVLGGMGLDPRLAKLAAVAVSFAVTYVLRGRLVFTLPTERRA